VIFKKKFSAIVSVGRKKVEKTHAMRLERAKKSMKKSWGGKCWGGKKTVPERSRINACGKRQQKGKRGSRVTFDIQKRNFLKRGKKFSGDGRPKSTVQEDLS